MTKKHHKKNNDNMLDVEPLTYLEEWKKERADFLNYKKEESKRIEGGIRFSNQKFILGIINILDNIYLAEKNLPDELKENQWVEGILQTKDQILDFLKANGVKEIECLDEEFDPTFHEAIDIIEGDSKSGTVIEEIKKGYVLHDRVIRASKVKIAR